MPQMQDEAGNIWEVNPDGTHTLVAPASPARQGRVFDLPRNPKELTAEARQAAADARAAEAANRAQGSDTRAAAAAERAEREWNATHNPDGSPKPKAGGATDAKAQARQANLDALVGQIRRVEDLFGENVEGFNWNAPPLGIAIPNQSNKQFDAAAAGLAEQGLAAFRVPGVGAQSDTELRQFVAANKPSAANYDSEILEKLRQLKLRVDANRVAMGLPPVDWENQAQQRTESEVDKAVVAGGTEEPPDTSSPPGLPPANAPGGQDLSPPETIASGATRWVDDPRSAALVNSLVNAGAGEATINAALKDKGYPPMPLGQFQAVRKWMQRNPGQRYNAASAGQKVPLSMLERAAGSTLGSGVANYADAATAGISTALAGDRGRGALDAMNTTNPNAAAVGSILGGITGAGAAEIAALRLAPTALARFAPRIADTLYGGVAGATSADEGEGGTGALLGAGAGLAGGVLGERAMRAAGAISRGVSSPSVRRLRDEGIPLTVGQTVGDSGRFGEFIKGVEDRMAGLPLVGDMVNARRLEGLEGFNQAAMRTAAAPGATITATGAPGMAQVRQSVGDAYDRALDPVMINTNIDPQMVDALAQARLAAAVIPNVQPTAPSDFAMSSLENRIQGNVDDNGLISGRGFQEGYRGLSRDARARANSDYGHEIGQVARHGQDVLGEALERQNPGAFEGFLEANAANRRANVLATALERAANQGDELITPAQLNRADVQSTSRLTGKINSASGNRPFYDLATAGQAVLPSKVPDSGTAGRLATAVMLGGAGGGGYALGGEGGAATGLGATLALALGGTKGVQRALSKALLDRPDVAITIGEELRRRAALGGAAGGGILAQIVAGQ